MSDHRPHVILVGHCSPDSGMLTSLVTRHAPNARVERVNDHASLAAHRRAGVVWLVNRALDGDFRHDGLRLVEDAAADDGPTLVLISNYADAQAAATARGALPGFGKSSLYAAGTVNALKAALAHAAERASAAHAKKP
ncbi:MAG: hypothetical protein JNM94_14735 [Phycisphaerae bacterium]|nr:hypothetical protein [Phycisphaerae bacterium]